MHNASLEECFHIITDRQRLREMVSKRGERILLKRGRQLRSEEIPRLARHESSPILIGWRTV